MANKENRTKVLPPTYFLIAILLMIVLNFLLPKIQLFLAWWRLLGLVPIIAGIMANLFADGIFKKAATTVRPFEESSTLVTTGIYSITRNPMYLGMVLILLGIMLLLNNLLLLGVVIIFVLFISTKFIQVEEEMLAANFGKDWLNYKSKTRRWIWF